MKRNLDGPADDRTTTSVAAIWALRAFENSVPKEDAVLLRAMAQYPRPRPQSYPNCLVTMMTAWDAREVVLNRRTVIHTLAALACGADPTTGEVAADSGPLQNPVSIRALFLAIRDLEAIETAETSSPGAASVGKKRRLPKPGLERTGQSWLPEEETRLSAAFDRGVSVGQLAHDHQRTPNAIRIRLERLAKITT